MSSYVDEEHEATTRWGGDPSSGWLVVHSGGCFLALFACVLMLNLPSCTRQFAVDDVPSAAATNPTTQATVPRYLSKEMVLDIARQTMKENGVDPADWPVESVEYVDASCSWVVKSVRVMGRPGVDVIVLPNGKSYLNMHAQ
jgi:hypothetical protein